MKKIALSTLIFGSLSSCVAYTDGYANNDQNSYYSNPTFNNGYYYAPNSYYGNGGYYGNDGYYYRDNMNYQYDNNVPYYYGQNNRKIYVQRQNVSQRPENGLQEPEKSRTRNNGLSQPSTNNQNRTQNSNNGFRNPALQQSTTRNQPTINRTLPTPTRNQNNNEVQSDNNTKSGVNNSGGFRTTNSNRLEDSNNGRR